MKNVSYSIARRNPSPSSLLCFLYLFRVGRATLIDMQKAREWVWGKVDWTVTVPRCRLLISTGFRWTEEWSSTEARWSPLTGSKNVESHRPKSFGPSRRWLFWQEWSVHESSLSRWVRWSRSSSCTRLLRLFVLCTAVRGARVRALKVTLQLSLTRINRVELDVSWMKFGALTCNGGLMKAQYSYIFFERCIIRLY